MRTPRRHVSRAATKRRGDAVQKPSLEVHTATRTVAVPDPRHSVPALRLPEILTPQERNVAALLCEGMTATAIAHRLVISPRTVEKHLSNIYAKFGVCDR